MAEKCNDIHCPVHNSLSLHGRSFTGTVISTKMQKTAVIEWEFKRFVPKFERYEKRKSKIKAHNADCLKIKKGDIVEIKECRPLSKTKHFIIIKKLGEDILFEEKQELLEQGKTRSKKKAPEIKEQKVENNESA
ncbi:30S ribosomal protein S17 [Candidatus Woesearchaeota archaeon]|nr:30S ribosomal protein S17 [Candidatus Woesearchaeota archaeon]MBW2978542.1 30S ribosomal protein S17 [Candidatus Woesearchaeota archaeon]